MLQIGAKGTVNNDLISTYPCMVIAPLVNNYAFMSYPDNNTYQFSTTLINLRFKNFQQESTKLNIKGSIRRRI